MVLCCDENESVKKQNKISNHRYQFLSWPVIDSFRFARSSQIQFPRGIRPQPLKEIWTHSTTMRRVTRGMTPQVNLPRSLSLCVVYNAYKYICHVKAK